MSIGAGTTIAASVVQTVFRQFGDESGAQISEADVIRWINEAQRDIVTHNREVNQALGEIPLTSGSAVYNVNSLLPGVIRIHSVMIGNRMIESVTFEESQELILSEESTGEPRIWFRYAGILNLWPAPDKAETMKVYYNRAPSIVTQASDLLTVPDNYYTAVQDYCLKKAYELDENPQMVGVKNDDFGRSLTANALDNADSNRKFFILREDDY